jgi:hypothetical protein
LAEIGGQISAIDESEDAAAADVRRLLLDERQSLWRQYVRILSGPGAFSIEAISQAFDSDLFAKADTEIDRMNCGKVLARFCGHR